MKQEDKKFWQFLRSGLRRLSQRYPPLYEALAAAKRPYNGPNKRQKVCYECAECKGLFPTKDVAVDHIKPCGPLNCKSDVPEFIETLFCEGSNLQVLCSTCHNLKTIMDKHSCTKEEAIIIQKVAAFNKMKSTQQIKFLTECNIRETIHGNSRGRAEQYHKWLKQQEEQHGTN